MHRRVGLFVNEVTSALIRPDGIWRVGIFLGIIVACVSKWLWHACSMRIIPGEAAAAKRSSRSMAGIFDVEYCFNAKKMRHFRRAQSLLTSIKMRVMY